MTSPGHGPAAWREILHRRVVTVAVLLALWAAGIEARLVVLQVVRHADLAARAERQQMRTQPLPPKRGDILDRHGRILATSVDADSIVAVPTEVGDARLAVQKICDALADCTPKEQQNLVDRLNQPRAFAYVRRQVAQDQAQRVAALNLDGIGTVKESKRFYPNRELAAHLLGWVGVDNKGLDGLESAYDAQIKGKAGTVLVHTDARRHAFSRFERPPTSGSTVELTIDEYLQHVTERELHAGVVENRAGGGSAIILNPHTGEILAMANEPTFNPNAFRDFDDSERRNRAVQDLYEPGSTFKVVTVSAALEEKVMTPETMIDTHPGRIQVAPGRVVKENENHDYGVISLANVIAMSSNIGAIKIGFRLGTDRLSRFVSLFGFGHQVSPDFPGESSGIVWSPTKWNDGALASVSMGYQVGVTPLQIVGAVGSVANGGEYIEPRVIRAVYRNGVRYAVTPKVVRRTISADTAALMTGIMEGVVDSERGTARAAKIPGYTIAGKTGTASKLVNGHYSHSDYNASFVGFLPSRSPAVAIVVVIDSPHGPNRYFGGTVAAPIFKKIAEPTLRYLGVGPSINPPAPILVARRDDTPSPASATPPNDPVVSLIADGPPGTVPDLRGMSAREAVRALVKLGVNARVAGDGVVVSQEPAPGLPLEPGSVCRLTLERSPRRAGRAGAP
ncbi:MAG: PASTA domain-containing protein [Acidobacteria bacterium]|nr:PASTA domain-containing protein [Acidobacteriota bacterium]